MATRKTERLSAVVVRNIAVPGYYADGAGLVLQVSRSGSKSWIFRYQRHGKAHEAGMGSYPLCSLQEAREKAVAARKLLAGGRDPLHEKRAAKVAQEVSKAQRLSFADAVGRYIAAQSPKWKGGKSEQQWRGTMRDHVLPLIGDLPVAVVDVPLVLRVLQNGDFWTQKAVTADRVRNRIERVIDWAVTAGFRPAGPNPAAWKGCLQNVLPAAGKIAKVEHFAALGIDEVHDFVVKLRQQGTMAAIALEVLVLTVVRTSDVLGMRWLEVDLDRGVWTIPGARMKAGRPHVVYLVPSVVKLLRSITALNSGSLVFATGPEKPLKPIVMWQLMKKMGCDATPHGMRATFKSWATERSSHQPLVVEMALAHVSGDRVAEAYQRSELVEKRKRLMIDWARHIETKPAQPVENVVPMRGAK